jgi:hypothetical protein
VKPTEAALKHRILQAPDRQARRSSSAAAIAGDCWRCHAQLPGGAAFFCAACSAIQPADASLSFYAVMGL